MPPKRTDAVVSYKDDDDDEKAAIRSAQNRKAQRLYRQRKEARIRELEATVARLAATEESDTVTPREAELMRRIEILETENSALKATASQPYHPTYPMYPMHGYHPYSYSYYPSYCEQGYNHAIPPSHAPFCQSPSNPHFAPHLTDMTTCESIESNNPTFESTAIERILQELPSLKNCSSTVHRFCRLFEDICRIVKSPKSLKDDVMSKVCSMWLDVSVQKFRVLTSCATNAERMKAIVAISDHMFEDNRESMILVQTQLVEASKAFNRRKAGSASTFLAVVIDESLETDSWSRYENECSKLDSIQSHIALVQQLFRETKFLLTESRTLSRSSHLLQSRNLHVASLQIQILLLCSSQDRIEVEKIFDRSRKESSKDVETIVNALDTLKV
ncbi:hypothetical protein BCR33DRAFT_825444 [Rhizoclosmatium globosum]|uniref:BZIP domain-containing protein n=1 Tax=Rhizoclosmatium globosum TaxID=329046 RepID=A0A1Y2C3T6_9FUNG|nr:hypothetical protein BCR33DRAFT_825444 [Rhizoclosmatium globosum]|eukprot:ORY41557.1 hypothetical protein BCR33DRAFT_825444 [Rhizoclosmatium globosum]